MVFRRAFLIFTLALAGFFAGLLPTTTRATEPTAGPTIELIMVEQDGCVYCIAWKDTIGPIYPKTSEGKFAPLRLADIHDGAPDGVTYTRRVTFTPTFILLENNQEIGRIEGYPGEEIFWWMLEKILTDQTDFSGTS